MGGETMEHLNELAAKIYEGNKRKGFDVANENIGQSLMLVVSEISEALEADRIDKHTNRDTVLKLHYETDLGQFITVFKSDVKDSFEDEISDAMIRLFDLCGGLGIDIERHIELKLRYNETRALMHGKKY